MPSSFAASSSARRLITGGSGKCINPGRKTGKIIPQRLALALGRTRCLLAAGLIVLSGFAPGALALELREFLFGVQPAVVRVKPAVGAVDRRDQKEKTHEAAPLHWPNAARVN